MGYQVKSAFHERQVVNKQEKKVVSKEFENGQ